MGSPIIFSRLRQLGIITLDNQKALNALTLDAIQTLQKQLTSFEKDPAIHAVIIKASPGKAFCAGGDVKSLYNQKNTPASQRDFFWQEYRLNHYVHHYPKPYIALMDGITMGGGVGISLHGSHPVASENFVFAMPETGIGFFPDIGASFLLSKMPDFTGLYAGLSGNRFDAWQALQTGLVKEVVPSLAFDDLVAALANLDLRSAAFEKVSRCLGNYKSTTRSLKWEDSHKISRYFSLESIHAILSALNKDKDDWAQSLHQQLLQKSPLSLKITFQQFKRAASLDLAGCLKMDYILATHFMQHPDFYEGVRALLIDKDKQPIWEFSTVENTPDALVDAFFESGQGTLELP